MNAVEGGAHDPPHAYHGNRPCCAGARGKRPPAALFVRSAAMTSIDHFAIATETLGKQCIELSRPPHDVRFGDDGLISVDTRTGQYRATAKIVVDGMVFIDMRGPLKELAEIKKRNGSSNARTILEESARQAIAEAEAQQAADEECEAALAANR